MTRRSPALLAGAILTAALSACSTESPTGMQSVQLAVIEGADHGGAPMSTDMMQEITTTVTGDPDGTGYATITINVGQREVCWDVTASGVLLPATASHIHKAAAGLSGPIVVGLTPPNAAGRAIDCRTVDNRELLKDILQNPTAYYVNVHTSEYPAGAVRGQLGD